MIQRRLDLNNGGGEPGRRALGFQVWDCINHVTSNAVNNSSIIVFCGQFMFRKITPVKYIDKDSTISA